MLVLSVVLELIPKSYALLGGPPSFDTVTRDTFAPGKCLSVAYVVEALRCMASVGAHLHALGISHGDLYAHNVVANSVGKAILCDYGAATYYEKSDRNEFHILEQFEVRAFGCLIEDLLSLAKSSNTENVRFANLCKLKQLCCNSVPNQRPTFTEILQQLKAMS